MFWCWLASVGLVYSTLFGFGKVLLGEFGIGAALLGFAALMVLTLYLILSKIGWEQIGD
jgi:hypothetical protein